ncbi:hypothetical protein [Acaryochloris marina]|uniref:hypothetical protein n=1 Tax=Acaryochloris marina TaxID=155978 RepID=UPI0021C36B7F|nr:hypothetical protein [Acaryochloris marina]BDM83712.1 hypothetical protein AM10699_65730 [Acaryochloris marina MBIC10699]
MASKLEQIKGVPLKSKPAEISRCGMSHSKFAQHRFTKEWFKLSEEGQVLGSPLDLDFYRDDSEPDSGTQSREKTQELAQTPMG